MTSGGAGSRVLQDRLEEAHEAAQPVALIVIVVLIG